MSYFRIWSVVFIIFIVLALPDRGNCEVQAEQLLSLEQAVLIALKSNPGFQQQANAVESAKISVFQQRADFYPDLNASVAGQESSQADLSLSTELSSTLNLYNGFADSAALKNAELELAAVQENLTREQQTLVFETFSNFVQVITDQALIQVKEENLAENRKLLEQIETFQQAGRLALSDLYQQQADTKQAQQDLLEAQQTLNNNKLLLMQTMGLVPMIDYRAAAPDFTSLSMALSDADIERLPAAALTDRADIKAQQHQIEAAGQQIRQAKSGQLPKVDFFAKLASGYNSSANEAFSEQLMDDSLDAIVGISLSIPIFDRYLTRNEVAKVKIDWRNEQLALKQKELQVGLERTQAIQEYRTTQQQIEVVDSKLTSARQSLQSYEERYRVGASTLVELSQARTDYVTAAFEQIEARYDLVNQQVALAYYFGDLEPLFAALHLEKN